YAASLERADAGSTDGKICSSQEGWHIVDRNMEFSRWLQLGRKRTEFGEIPARCPEHNVHFGPNVGAAKRFKSVSSRIGRIRPTEANDNVPDRRGRDTAGLAHFAKSWMKQRISAAGEHDAISRHNFAVLPRRAAGRLVDQHITVANTIGQVFNDGNVPRPATARAIEYGAGAIMIDYEHVAAVR